MLLLALVAWTDIGTGPFVVVGGFAPGGLNVNNYYYDNENNGVAALRKSCYFPHWAMKNSMGDGLYPAADHSPYLLHHCLNLEILGIVNRASVLCQSNQHFKQVELIADDVKSLDPILSLPMTGFNECF